MKNTYIIIIIIIFFIILLVVGMLLLIYYNKLDYLPGIKKSSAECSNNTNYFNYENTDDDIILF